MASAGEELTLSERLTPSTVGPTGEAGMPAPEVYRPLWPCASTSHLSLRSLWVSVFVPAGDCPLPWVSTDAKSRGGLFLPQSESGGESGPQAGCWRLGNRCDRGVGAARRGEGPSWGKTRGEIPRDRWGAVCGLSCVCL